MTDNDAWLPDIPDLDLSDLDRPDPDTEVRRLAALSPAAYEGERKASAKALGWRTSTLDAEVERARPKQHEEEDTPSPFRDVEPWPDPVVGSSLLDDLRATVLRFCVLPAHTAEIVSAWILHAWAHDAADVSPILAITSPEKRCGKTTVVSVVSALAPRPLNSVNASTSVVFRVIEAHRPTLLVDEADTFLAANDELRGVLNGGHNRLSAWVWRNVGDDHEPKAFNVWAPKVIAMIGRLPDTLEDRALVVRLRRKSKGETVERFRAAKLAEFEGLRRRCARWAKDHDRALREADPAVPDSLNDRAQDNARSLCAIADAAGGHWPQTLRLALTGNADAAQDDEPESAGALLLRDIGDIFSQHTSDKIGSARLVEMLVALEDSPWGEWRRGQPVTPRSIKKLLSPYGIGPRRDRFGAHYLRADFADTLERYSQSPSENPSHPSHPSHHHASDTQNSNESNDVLRNDACDGYSGVTAGTRHQSSPSTTAAGEYEPRDDPSNPEAWR